MPNQDIKTIELLKELGRSAKFVTDIEKVRAIFKIPKGGFKDEKEADNKRWTKNSWAKYVTWIKILTHKYNLPVDNNAILDDYIAQGINLFNRSRNFTHVYQSSIVFAKDRVIIEMRPGASKRDVIKLLALNKEQIDAFFARISKDSNVKTVRQKTKRKRDEKIYELYKFGALNYDGSFYESKGIEYLEMFGGKNLDYSNLLHCFFKMGISLPGESAIHNIIREMNKQKKN